MSAPDLTGKRTDAPRAVSFRVYRPAGFTPARPYQSEGLAGGRDGALETALAILSFRRGLVLGEALPDDAAVVLVSRRQQRHRPPLKIERQVGVAKALGLRQASRA